MLFSSPVFIFLFLPILFILYYSIPPSLLKVKNTVLVVFSLFFYAWGETFFVLIMLVSISMNYFFGLLINKQRTENIRKFVLLLAVAANLSLIGYFKYADFIIENLNAILPMLSLSQIKATPVHLPLGISFFTFQAMSYVIDINRNQAAVQKNIMNVALYISLFPQLIAGPIIRYHDIAKQIASRVVNIDIVAYGIKRFIMGLAKKMLIANTLGEVADKIFSIPSGDMTSGLAWLGIASYSMQIYFDFSGYSDMAIGLGRMFGFKFMENFNYPYISGSLREFWQRWHISLSTWFRDYLYIPMGGARCATWRVYFNLFTVFFLCGLWHGASWNFVIWGMMHGFFLVIERIGFHNVLSKLWKPVSITYVLLVVTIAWVFFRADNLNYAMHYLKAMAGLGQGDNLAYNASMYTDMRIAVVFFCGVLFSTPVYPFLKQKISAFSAKNNNYYLYVTAYSFHVLILCLLFCASVMRISADTYNPFIYFRF
ncbi:MAG: MBOAT family protein [Desulfobacterales bacterium]|nr:MBOAT family protein [Desulfobacterales bacterium]